MSRSRSVSRARRAMRADRHSKPDAASGPATVIAVVAHSVIAETTGFVAGNHMRRCGTPAEVVAGTERGRPVRMQSDLTSSPSRSST